MSSRRSSTLGCIEIALRRFDCSTEAWLEIGIPLHEINVAREQIFESELQAEVSVPTVAAEQVVVKLHHEVQVALLRIERPLHCRSENRQPFHAILLAQRPHLAEVLRDDLR